MESSTEPTTITLGMSPEDAFEFVKKLAFDDDFRERLRQDPEGVLTEEGMTITGPHVFQSTFQLPPKHEVRILLEDLGEFDEEQHMVTSHESIGYGLFAILWHLAHAMPFIDLELAGDAAD